MFCTYKIGDSSLDIWHYSDVKMGAMASQITSLTIVYSTVYSDADQRKHQSSASLAFVWGIHRGPVNSPHKWPVTQKTFEFDDVIMTSYRADEFMIGGHTHTHRRSRWQYLNAKSGLRWKGFSESMQSWPCIEHAVLFLSSKRLTNPHVYAILNFWGASASFLCAIKIYLRFERQNLPYWDTFHWKKNSWFLTKKFLKYANKPLLYSVLSQLCHIIWRHMIILS